VDGETREWVPKEWHKAKGIESVTCQTFDGRLKPGKHVIKVTPTTDKYIPISCLVWY
jgi:hypothetical protein